MGEKYQELVAHLTEIRNLTHVISLVGWDQQVNMPPGGSEARASQLATLSRLEHELLVSETTKNLLEEAGREVGGAAYDLDAASMVRVSRQDYEDETSLPTKLVIEMAEATARAHHVWATARAENDFAAFVPTLEHLLDLKRQEAEARGYTDHPYDALLDTYDRGMTAKQVKTIFDAHKPGLVRLIAAIKENSGRVSDAPVHQAFDIEKQRAFGVRMVSAYGYDFERGRQDEAVHPFCTNFSQNDVRITTRFNANFLNPALFGTMHEAGHAMYEQGVDPALEGTPLSRGASLSVHELQSRMWENFVGRSKAFWSWAYPQLQATFPDQLGSVDLDTFYKAINKVQPSYIRVEADEATYNLHIMLRFELEMEMIAGNIPVKRLPQEWNDRFEAFLGITPPTDALGVLQDVHWSMGLMGYFPTYALGNLLAAQYYRKAQQDRPGIADDIASGRFETLLGWLRENIHRHGRKFTTSELTQKVTGGGIDPQYYEAYLTEKYGEIYGL